MLLHVHRVKLKLIIICGQTQFKLKRIFSWKVTFSFNIRSVCQKGQNWYCLFNVSFICNQSFQYCYLQSRFPWTIECDCFFSLREYTLSLQQYFSTGWLTTVGSFDLIAWCNIKNLILDQSQHYQLQEIDN